MALAGERLDRFASRLREVHLSSLRGENHVSVRSEDEAAFAEVLDRCREVPWILEAAPPARWARRLAPRLGQRAALLADGV